MNIVSLIISGLLMGMIFFLFFPSLLMNTKRRQDILNDCAVSKREVFLDKRLLWFFWFGAVVATTFGALFSAIPTISQVFDIDVFPVSLFLWVVSVFDLSVCFLASTRICFDCSKMSVKNFFGRTRTILFDDIVSISGKNNKCIHSKTDSVIIFNAFSGKEELFSQINEWKNNRKLDSSK